MLLLLGNFKELYGGSKSVGTFGLMSVPVYSHSSILWNHEVSSRRPRRALLIDTSQSSPLTEPRSQLCPRREHRFHGGANLR